MDNPCTNCICDCDKSCISEIQEKAYQQGREDKYQEIIAEYMLLTEKQVSDIMADAIDECIDILNDSFPFIANMDIVFGYKCAVERLEQLKEQKGGAENENF